MFNWLNNPLMPNPIDEQMNLDAIAQGEARRRRAAQRRREATIAMMEQNDYNELEELRDEVVILRDQLEQARLRYCTALRHIETWQAGLDKVIAGEKVEDQKTFINTLWQQQFRDDEALRERMRKRVIEETPRRTLKQIREDRK